MSIARRPSSLKSCGSLRRDRIKTEEEVVVKEESGGGVSDAIQGENPVVGL